MLFQDNGGNLLMPDEVDELSCYEIGERGIHVYDEDGRWLAQSADEWDDAGDKDSDEEEDDWASWALYLECRRDSFRNKAAV